jgi:hypothetical protein
MSREKWDIFCRVKFSGPLSFDAFIAFHISTRLTAVWDCVRKWPPLSFGAIIGSRPTIKGLRAEKRPTSNSYFCLYGNDLLFLALAGVKTSWKKAIKMSRVCQTPLVLDNSLRPSLSHATYWFAFPPERK